MRAINNLVLALSLLLFYPVFSWADEAADFKQAQEEFYRGDKSKAVALYKTLADGGHQAAMEAYAAEKDRNAEWEEALSYYRKLAEKNVAQAEYRIGVFYGLGYGVDKNNQEAVNWITRAADHGNKFAINTLVRAYLKQWACITLDPATASQEKALVWLKQSADNDYAPALQAMAEAYRKGRFGLTVDNAQAADLEAKFKSIQDDFKKATDSWIRADFTVSSRILAKLTEKDYAPAWALFGFIADKTDLHDEAVEYFNHAAEQGYAEGQYLLAGAYSVGNGVKQNNDLMRAWMEHAAELGYVAAIKSMAKIYVNKTFGLDEKTATDEKVAYWLKKAAAVEDIDSIVILLDAYRTGKYGLTAEPQQIEQLQMLKDKIRPPEKQKGKRKWMQ